MLFYCLLPESHCRKIRRTRSLPGFNQIKANPQSKIGIQASVRTMHIMSLEDGKVDGPLFRGPRLLFLLFAPDLLQILVTAGIEPVELIAC